MVIYLMEAPEPTEAQLAEIAKLESAAAHKIQRERESFDRCDTDGFLSQWASSIGARKDSVNISILRNGGCVAVSVLCNASGEIVTDRQARFPKPQAPWLTNTVWRLPDELYQQLGRRWVPVGSRSRVQKQLGLHEECRWVPGYAKITAPAGATGLGGCASAYVGHFRSDTGEEV